jgi:hypothetical protein
MTTIATTSNNTTRRRKKNRKMINRYLQRIGRQAGLDDLQVDSYGYCWIPFRKFLIIVHHNDEEEIQFDTMVFDLNDCINRKQKHCHTRQYHHPHHHGTAQHTAPAEIVTAMKTRSRVMAMQIRGVCLGKHKSAIRIDENDEVHLYNVRPIKGLKFDDMADLLDDFMSTAVNIHSDLAAIRR